MNKEKVVELIESLNINRYTSEYDIQNQLEEMNIENVNCTSGSCKVCLIFEDLDFVIKWGKWSGLEAIQECTIYDRAIEKGLDFLFPKTYIFKVIDDITFIAQEKIDFSCATLPFRLREKYSKQSKTVSKRIYKKMSKGFTLDTDYDRTLDALWANMVISLYGKKITKTLCEFVKENRINDLHEYNLGYKNNRPIFLDFSGYYK